MRKPQTAEPGQYQAIIGALSGKKITIPNVNVPPMPALAAPGVIHRGQKVENFGLITASRGYRT